MGNGSYIALNRFGMGPEPDQITRISANPQGWLLSQILRQPPVQSYALPSSQDLIGQYADIQKIKKDKSDKDSLRMVREDMRSIIMKSLENRFKIMVETDTPLIERMVLFWSNVFTVSSKGKPQLIPLCMAFERDAIRPYIFGKFEDMLIAATKHPAMLMYLNNAQSIGPNSRAGQRRDKGLNENLARETLELHSLGVNGGYTQADVISLAKIITGWTIVSDRIQKIGNQNGNAIQKDENGFAFVSLMHEPGPQKILGKVYNDSGFEQGVSVLRDLARHPSTANYMAMRLLIHFCGDNPPQNAITSIADVFYRTGGDLAEVTAALIRLPDVWQTPMPKVKSPYELIVAQFRALGLSPSQIPFKVIYQALNDMGNIPMTAPSPAGWADKTDDWISASSMMKRIEWAQAISLRSNSAQNPSDLAKNLYGESLQPDTLQAIQRAPSQSDAITLLLTSPEMQRR